MSKLVIVVYFAYLPVFATMQQIIGYMSGARNVDNRSYSLEVRAVEYIFTIVALNCYIVFGLTVQSFLVASTSHLLLRIFGMMLMIAGLVASGWAKRYIGKNWTGGTFLHRGHSLITDGPFKYVRHPMYAGVLLSAIGQCLVALNVWLQLGAVFFACSFLIRIPREEMLLASRYKHKWHHYSKTTNMVVPSFKKG